MRSICACQEDSIELKVFQLVKERFHVQQVHVGCLLRDRKCICLWCANILRELGRRKEESESLKVRKQVGKRKEGETVWEKEGKES